MTASPNNIIITKTDKSGTKQVTIATHRVEEIWSKQLTPIDLPTTRQNQSMDVGANDTQIVDLLLKSNKRYSIDGKISTDVGTSDTHNDAYDKKEDMKTIFFGGGTFTLNWEGVNHTVNIDKLQSTWEANDRAVVIGGVITPIITSYTVKFTCIEGVDFSNG